MNKLHYFAAALLILSAVAVRADDAVKRDEKASEKPVEKPARRLKGEFKGHPIAAPSDGETEVKAEPPKQPGKPAEKALVIDNTLIQRGAPKNKGKTAAAAPPPAPVRAAAPPAPAPPAVVAFAPVDLNGNGEAYWRAKARHLRDTLSQAEQSLEAAQLEEKREENDFYAWDDGQYRDNVIKPAWDKSKEETARAQDELAAARKAADQLEDDARKAGAYPGWIRE